MLAVQSGSLFAKLRVALDAVGGGRRTAGKMAALHRCAPSRSRRADLALHRLSQRPSGRGVSLGLYTVGTSGPLGGRRS